MNILEIIRKKRDNKVLSNREIGYFVQNYTSGVIPDYQASALIMATYINGLNNLETFHLTQHMVNSGDVLDLSDIKGIKVDKHSTGGVGDKTTLVAAPIVASYGVNVAKMSGRGLGHTGGTIDKLESIPGFNVSLTAEKFISNVKKIGLSVSGQTENIATADKKIYTLRDVTATVNSIPLIAASIMSKKIASGSDCIVLDVKVGSGAFMKDRDNAIKLAKIMIKIGENAGKKTICLITDMDVPLGKNIGNSNEVKEAIVTLKGKGPKDFTNLCIHVAGAMLYAADKCQNIQSGKNMAKKSIENLSALDKFKEFVSYQNGDPSVINDYSILPKSEYAKQIVSDRKGFIYRMDCKKIGDVSMALGAGRQKINDSIDYSAGITLNKKTGMYVEKGDVLADIYSNDKSKLKQAEKLFLEAVDIKDKKPNKRTIIKAYVDKEKTNIFC